MRDVLAGIMVFFFIIYIIISIQTPNYKADEVQLIKDYPGWVVANKTKTFLFGREIHIVNPDNKSMDSETDNYIYFISYQLLFDKYEVGDTIKQIQRSK